MSETQTDNCPACGASLDITGAQIFAERTCPVCSTQINVRRKFGHYELLEMLGHGGQGLVFKAVDNTLNRLVALKLLRTEFAKDPEFIRQFESEAQVTASIKNPNVVRVYSFGAGEGHVYLAMELVGKGTMDDLMEKLGRIPEARALEIGIQIANGLKAGQERGLIHRDVKPGNILFAEDGSAKIVDFGLALILAQEAEVSGEIWGTPYYLSPERLNRVQEDARSDIYSLGATLFHAIAGRPPFEAETATGVAMKHLNATAVSIQAWAPDVTNATAFVINRTLSKNPDDRYSSYEEFIEQLHFARDEALKQAREGGKKAQSRLVIEDSGARKINSLVTIATLVVLVVGVGLGVWFMNRSGDKGKALGIEAVGLDSLGNEWKAARDLLAGGDHARSIEAFRALAENSKGEKKAWATVFQALSHQLAGNSQAASGALGLLDKDNALGRFYASFANTLTSSTPLTAESANQYGQTNHESVAALFLGLKAYNSGNVTAAAPLLRRFTTGNYTREFAFLSEFKKVARPFEDEITNFNMATDALKNAANPGQRTAAINGMKQFQTKLKQGSPLNPVIQAAIAAAEKTTQPPAPPAKPPTPAPQVKPPAPPAPQPVANQQAAPLSSVKITASAHGKNFSFRYNLAMDGDPATGWVAGADGPKWIQFDFGAEKKIGRWVLKHIAPQQHPSENNNRNFKLECSNDGTTWTLSDSVIGNQANTTDRLVKPFSARYVRVSFANEINQPVSLYEAEFTEASLMGKPAYLPWQITSVRFSPDSPMAFQPIGTVNKRPAVSFEPATGKYTINGSADDLMAKAESFHFVNQPVEGNFEFSARVADSRSWSRIGIMARSALRSDASQMAIVTLPSGQTQYILRQKSLEKTSGDIPNIRKLPIWFKLTRVGTTIAIFDSQDGVSWTKIREEQFNSLEKLVYTGLVVSTNKPGTLSAGSLDNVSLKPLP